MKERPILFSGPMVRAILDGRKTQTRRIVKPQTMALFDAAIHLGECSDFLSGGSTSSGDAKYLAGLCPYGQPHDRLWVKETYSAHGEMGDWGRKCYRADLGDDAKEPHGLHWRPSIFMSRAASRITLEITAVRVERLNSISAEDAVAEGIGRISNIGLMRAFGWKDYLGGLGYLDPVESYRSLWESINGAGSWDKNPWVWVIEFKARGSKA